MSSFTKMQELAVDLSSSGIRYKNESEAIDLTKVREIKVEEVRDSLLIELSNKIVAILEDKCSKPPKKAIRARKFLPFSGNVFFYLRIVKTCFYNLATPKPTPHEIWQFPFCSKIHQSKK